ncbi:MAG: pirin family protein [Phycisphaerales bacterium]|nr:pirin family protein [Phycisphaerales bacterium]
MISIRRGNERGHFDHGWLNTYHTFSFGSYNDPKHMGFRTLRVINEDRVQAGQGFGTHGHRDMEIISYVLEGALEHKDSMGNGSVLRPGDFQRMTAGTGVQHSEFNHSSSEPVHFYQIWLLPDRKGLAPGYEEMRRPEQPVAAGLRLVASPDGREGSLTVHQDAMIYLGRIAEGESVEHVIANGRHAWIQVLRGSIRMNDDALHAGDGAAISDELSVTMRGESDAELMVFDLA